MPKNLTILSLLTSLPMFCSKSKQVRIKNSSITRRMNLYVSTRKCRSIFPREVRPKPTHASASTTTWLNLQSCPEKPSTAKIYPLDGNLDASDEPRASIFINYLVLAISLWEQWPLSPLWAWWLREPPIAWWDMLLGWLLYETLRYILHLSSLILQHIFKN